MARRRKPEPRRVVAPRAPLSARARDRLGLALVYVCFLAYAIPYLVACLRSAWPTGWDGIGHFAVADVYMRKLFPSLSGWLPEYFGGMPFPTFYPPLFYLLVALVGKLIGVAAALWIVLIGSTLVIPWLIHRCTRELTGSSVAAFVAAALAAGFMLDEQLPSFLGISLFSTFDIGLHSQPLSFCFLLLGYHAYLRSDREPRARLSAGLWLAAVVLSNVHVVWNAALLFGAHTVADLLGDRAARVAALRRAFEIAAITALVSSCWLVPMIAHLAWVPTAAVPPPPAQDLTQVMTRCLVYVSVAGLGALWGERNRRVLALVASLLAMMIFSLSSLLQGLRDLPLQPGRVLVGCECLATIAIGYLVAQSRLLSTWRHTSPTAAVVCIALFALRWHPVHAPRATIDEREAASYRGVLEALAGHTEARVLAEHGDTLGNGFAMQALLGSAGLRSATTIFRESSPMALFDVPMRNLLSEHREEYGVDTKLPNRRMPPSVLDAPALARLRWLGIRYLVAYSPSFKGALRASADVERVSREDMWEAWQLRTPMGPLAAVPRFPPVLTFCRLSVKVREDHGLDFIRLGEEAFLAARFDHVFVHAPDTALDASPDWGRFEAALVVDYRYRDREAAFRVLERFSAQHPLVLVEDPDPLFTRLVALGRPTIRVAHRERPLSIDDGLLGREAALTAKQDAALAATRTEAAQIFDALDALLVPIPDAPRVLAAELGDDRTTVTLSAPSSRPVPVWIQQAYFPLWHGPAPVYLASPAYTFTFVSGDHAELRFGGGTAERLGWGLFALGVLLCASLWVRLRRAGAAPAP